MTETGAKGHAIVLGGSIAKRNNPAAQSWSTRFLLWYTERMQATATRSAFVSKTIAGVQNMIAPPTSLFTPGMFFRVLFA